MPATQHLHCPKCHGGEITCHGKRYALYPAGCVTLFALPLAWVHRESTPIDFECRTCGHRFCKRTKPAQIAYAALWVSTILIICALLKVCLFWP